MSRYAMVIDLRKCVGCDACTVACRTEWDVPIGHSRTWVEQNVMVGEFPNVNATNWVAQCNHCDEPSCIPPCPTGATFQKKDGSVVVDTELCIGCGFCVEACPYDARYVNPLTNKVDKCDFCEARLGEGLLPACVTTCTGNAKFFGDLEDRNSVVYKKVYREGAWRNENENASIGPNVYYLGTPEQLEIVKEKFGPRQSRMATPAEMWKDVIKPLVFTAVAATFAGQAVAFFEQLRKGEEPIDE
ncbi:MAG: 4Fe-4S dicluster domain-containing protein [Chlorobi bacterium]|nr:4Fe-4S dicluster domain-containing protein [Chlorobiota bacterium]